MIKKVIAITSVILLLPTVLAHHGSGTNTHMMGSYWGMSGWMLTWWVIGIAIAAFIFGIIFWWTYKLIIKKE